MFRDRDRHVASPARDVALDCLAAGIEAASPARAVERHLELDGDVLRVGGEGRRDHGGDGADDRRDAGADAYDLDAYDRVLVVGAGKAAVGLAAALVDLLGDRLDGGAVVADAAPDDPDSLDLVDVVVGDHPVPGEGSREGGRRALDLAERADERTLVLAAITGGGSALLAAPADGVAFDDLRDVTDALVRSGAGIDGINAVRKHASAVKGGRLAKELAPAAVVGLLVSDVVGDDPGVVASGPIAPDDTTFADAVDVLDRYGIDGGSVRSHVEAGTRGEREETPTAADPAFDRVRNYVVASARTAVDAAREVAAERGYEPCVLSTTVEGEAREVGPVHAAVASEVAASGDPVEPPAVLLSAGECTVTVRGDGRGGPNQEFALAAAAGLPAGAALGSVDTDGEDGATDAAGALVDASTVGDAAAARDALDANDAYAFLEARDALLRTGKTGTNANDLRVVVVPEPG